MRTLVTFAALALVAEVVMSPVGAAPRTFLAFGFAAMIAVLDWSMRPEEE
jgi:hypothetical protein